MHADRITGILWLEHVLVPKGGCRLRGKLREPPGDNYGLCPCERLIGQYLREKERERVNNSVQ